jgi:divalent metal cation (Fe/Co/Zn/Cd) transporter
VSQRDVDLAGAVRASLISIAWSLAAGVAAIVVGLAANALSLLAYGLDAAVDGAASATILLDLRVELRGGSPPVHRRAERTVGSALVLIGAVVSVQSVRRLRSGAGPDHTSLGIAIAIASALVLPPLAAWKVWLGRRLHSPALIGDGFLTGAGGALAAVTLAGMVLDRSLGWWWADPAAAAAIAVFLVVAGVLTLRDRGSHART